MSTGYSIKSVIQKLGAKPHSTLLVVNAPNRYESLLGALPEGLKIIHQDSEAPMIHIFVTTPDQVVDAFDHYKKLIPNDGTIWISWPKKTATIASDLNENSIRDIGLAAGMVDVKVMTFDDAWSGLKFVYRLKDRAG